MCVPFCLVLLLCACLSVMESPAQEADDEVLSLDSLLALPINTVSKSWQTVRLAPASVTIITSRDIQRFGYRTLEDVLRSVRGFYTSNDRNYSYIGVRGFSRPGDYNDRLLVLLNGHYANEHVYGSASYGYDFPLNFNAVERIEIVRGPGSVVYGTGAMFAVINIVTRSGAELDGISVAGEVGSFGRTQVQMAAGKEFDNGLSASMFAVWGDATGQGLYFPEFDTDSTDGIARNLDGERYYSLFGRIGYSDITVQAYASSRRKDIPTASFGMVFNQPGAETIDTYTLVEARYAGTLSPGMQLTLRGNYNTYIYEGAYVYPGLSPDATVNKWLGTEARLQWDLRPDLRMIAGAEYQDNLRADYYSEFEGEVLFDRDVPFSVLSLYLQSEYQMLENMNLTAGLRLDRHSQTGSTLSPRIGLIFNPAVQTTLKLLYGTGFRSPNFSEMHLEYPGSNKSNPGLRPEQIATWELVAEQQIADNWYAVASVFYNHMTNLIDQQIDDVDSLMQFRNLEASNAAGCEFEINARFPSGFRSYGSYTLQVAQDDDEHLSNSPRHLFKSGVSRMLGETLTVSLEALYESARKTVYDTETEPYLLASFLLGYRPFRQIECSLLVRNIFDTHYTLPGGFEHVQAGIPQDGRNFIARIQFSL